jgi:hypothetical protein
MLFWAEGSRRRNSVVFTNSDVEMHRVFLRFLRRSGVRDEQVALTVNCFLKQRPLAGAATSTSTGLPHSACTPPS